MSTARIDPVEKAKIFAIAAHAAIGQSRKYTNEPYTVHVAEVVEIVRSVPHTPEMLTAAWLHDVVEDTKIPLELIRQEFGEAVAALVLELTSPSKSLDADRATRKEIDRRHLAGISPDGQTIKLADIISNISNVYWRDLLFAMTYLPEKKAQIAVLTSGDPELQAIALGTVDNFLDKMKG